MFVSVFSRIIVIFIILLVGYLARWRNILTEETTDGLCRIALEVTLPFLYFSTLSTNLSPKLFFSLLTLPLYAVLLSLLSFLLTLLGAFYLKLKVSQRNTFIFLGTFANYGFLAIPLVFALFGEEGLVKMVIFNLGITFLYWTFGVAILSYPQKRGLGIFKNLMNNSIFALAVGLVVGLSAFTLPKFILESAKIIGSASIPLALIVIGSILAQKSTKQTVSVKTILVLIVCRLLIIPILVILFIHNFTQLPKMLTAIIVLQAAMPCASTTPIMTKKFGGDIELAASGVFFTTLFSIITVPLFISLVLR